MVTPQNHLVSRKRINTMLFKADKANKTTTDKPKGGIGLMSGLSYVAEKNRPDNTRLTMAAVNTLPPGGSLGVHTHQENEEIYLILEGTGIYTDQDGNTHPVGSGDLTLTRQTKSHALANTGNQPLVFAAIIVSDRK
jgi:mannose-6-phosphate isomerase-like protein (cupin superfamily)